MTTVNASPSAACTGAPESRTAGVTADAASSSAAAAEVPRQQVGWPPDAPIMFHVIEAIRGLRRTGATVRIFALETGTIRSYGEKHESTRHISAALGPHGHLISVDSSPESIRISRDICNDAPNVTWIESESIPFLKEAQDLRLSFALLDSANEQQLIMDEFTLVAPMMLPGGILMVDDAGVRTDKSGFDSTEAEKGRAVWRFLESCGARYAVLETPHGHGSQIKVPFDEENGRIIKDALRRSSAAPVPPAAPSPERYNGRRSFRAQ